ncbi:MAG: DNA polymerase III subunit gamma/tau [Limisphaerales bacterium]
MSYQVIARKYRPQRFADVVGQDHVAQTLSNAISSGRIAHAYLFCGPRGTGKTTIARIFAKCLNCTNGPSVEFSEEDEKCREIAEGRSLDVIEIDGASNNGVEQVRELRDTCKFAPSSSQYKIYIIDEVHMLTTAAFNALLKTLEEPPDHVKFLFATTDPEKVLATILSRCQRFDLRRIPAGLIVNHLAEIAVKEQVKIDDAALHAIARGADGGMRDAESTLDQLISFCGEEIKEEDVLSMFGLTARDQLLGLTGGILSGEVDTVLRELNALTKSGKDLGRLVADLLSHFRNLLIYQVSRGDLNLLEVSEAEANALKEQSEAAPADAVTRIMEVLTDYESRLRDAASKKIMVEVGLLKAVQARNAMPIDTVLKSLNEIRSGQPVSAAPAQSAPKAKAAAPAARRPAAAPPAPSPTPEPAPAPAPQPEPAKAAPPEPAASPTAPDRLAPDMKQLWQQVVEAAGQASPFTKTYLLESHPVGIERNVFSIGFDPSCADHLSLVDNPKVHALLKEKLTEAGQAGMVVKFVEASRPTDYAPPDVAPVKATGPAAESAEPEKEDFVFDKEEFKNDPLIKSALEIFKGEIVDIRK